jgi:hypothetical protein
MRKRTEPRITGLWFVGRSALSLTDEQLDQIMRCAAPLHPRIRRVFVELVAYALRGKVIGDGEVWAPVRPSYVKAACLTRHWRATTVTSKVSASTRAQVRSKIAAVMNEVSAAVRRLAKPMLSADDLAEISAGLARDSRIDRDQAYIGRARRGLLQ